ncbi:hypothetical protein ABTM83_20180, partial [Acinetobacter baumannii]
MSRAASPMLVLRRATTTLLVLHSSTRISRSLRILFGIDSLPAVDPVVEQDRPGDSKAIRQDLANRRKRMS